MANLLGIISLARRAGKVESGDDLVRRTIERKKASLIIISEDAANRTKDNYIYLANKAEIPIIFYGSKEVLGDILGKESRSVLAITDCNFSQGIIKAFERGELIEK
ncbi:MAG: 50S ribosomal protein L7ae [Peptococcaceae bacterium]|nr:50S ribosomal protein L7ae [Peptococcaceae bacterium]